MNDPEETVFSDKTRPDMDEVPNQDVESEVFDNFLRVYIKLPSNDGASKVLARVKNRKRDHDGKLVGHYNANPILNTSVYNIESLNGTISEYTANVIAENLWNQVDNDGYNYN